MASASAEYAAWKLQVDEERRVAAELKTAAAAAAKAAKREAVRRVPFCTTARCASAGAPLAHPPRPPTLLPWQAAAKKRELEEERIAFEERVEHNRMSRGLASQAYTGTDTVDSIRHRQSRQSRISMSRDTSSPASSFSDKHPEKSGRVARTSLSKEARARAAAPAPSPVGGGIGGGGSEHLGAVAEAGNAEPVAIW